MKKFILLSIAFALSFLSFSQKTFEVTTGEDDSKLEGSLRYYIENDIVQEDDIIAIRVDRITLKAPLYIGKSLHIYGMGKGKTIIDGSSFQGTIFTIASGEIVREAIKEAAKDTLKPQAAGDVLGTLIENITIANGTASGQFRDGGAIYIENDSYATFRNVKFLNNSAEGNGGAVAVGYSASVTFEQCDFTDNKASGGNGGAIALPSEAVSYGYVYLSNSTFSGNSATNGGAFYSGYSSFQVYQCTFSANIAEDNGGAIYFREGSGNIYHSTITKNRAGDAGGGLTNALATVYLSHTIIAGNEASRFPDVATEEIRINSQGYNFIGLEGKEAFSIQTEAKGDIFTYEDPMLGPLANNGGFTLTHHPLEGSPVIDKGDADLITEGEQYDQRGYDRIYDGVIDIGSVESQIIPCNNLVVTSTEDDGSTCGTLRYAVAYANTNPGADYIRFEIDVQEGVSPVIALNSPIDITDTLYISGSNVIPRTKDSAPVIISRGTNTAVAVRVLGGHSTVISDFVFSASSGAAIIVSGTNDVKIYNTIFGVNSTTKPASTANFRGIVIRNSFGSVIGGDAPNKFLSNTDIAVWVDSTTSRTAAIISRNIFSCNNRAIVNTRYNAPTIDTLRSGIIIGRARPFDFIEIYEDTTCSYNQGSRFLFNTQADENGRWSYFSEGTLFHDGVNYTATATNTQRGQTSPFSSPKTVEQCPTSLAFDAGPDVAVCGDTATIIPTTPLPDGWSGYWFSGDQSSQLINHGDSVSVILSLMGFSQVIWLAENGLSDCYFTDTVNITRSYPGFLGVDQSRLVCEDTIYMYASTSSSGFTWEILEGIATFEDFNNPSTRVYDMVEGDTILVKATSENGACPTLTDTLSIIKTAPYAPEVTISVLNNPKCTDDIVSLSVSTTPDYRNSESNLTWYMNGVEFDYYVDTVNIEGYNSEDTVYAAMSIYESCLTKNNDTSNYIVLNLDPHTQQGILNESGSNYFCSGDSISLILENSIGTTYRWYESLDDTLKTSIVNGVENDTILNIKAPVLNDWGAVYYSVIISNGCDTVINSASIYLEPQPTAGTISTSPVGICENDSVTLRLTNYTGEYVVWESFSDSEWREIRSYTDTISFVASTPGLYRAHNTNVEGLCAADTSETFELVPAPPASPITLGTGFTVCSGEMFDVQASGVLNTINWYLSTDGVTFSETTFSTMIGDSIASDVSFINQSDSILSYFVFAESYTSCDSKNSDTIQIIINPETNAGNLTTASINCVGDSVFIRSNGAVGDIFVWETYTMNGWEADASLSGDSIVLALNDTISIRLITLLEEFTCGSDTSDILALAPSGVSLVAVDDTISSFAGQASILQIDFLDNDINTASGILSWGIISVDTGSVSTDSDFLYYNVPNLFSGNVEISYFIENKCDQSDTASILIAINKILPIITNLDTTVSTGGSLTIPYSRLFTDADNNTFSILGATSLRSGARIYPDTLGFTFTADYSGVDYDFVVDTLMVPFLDAGGDTLYATVFIRQALSRPTISAGVSQSIDTVATILEAVPTPGFTSYWSPVDGISFEDRFSPTTLASGFKPEKSPYIMVWNVEFGNEILKDTVVITVTNVPPVIVITAPQIIIRQPRVVVRLDSLVTDANQNLANIRIVTPFMRLEQSVVEIDNNALTITIDLSKSSISDSTSLVDSLEYEICDFSNACGRAYIKVLREGIDYSKLISVTEISPKTIYNFLSPNADQLNGNFFFDIKILKSDNSETAIDIVTDNQAAGILRNGIDFTTLFTDFIDHIEVVIFNRWGDEIVSFDDYFGGKAYINGELLGDEISDAHVWKGKDKNGKDLTPGTYYYYIKIYSKVTDDHSTNGFIELRN